MWRVHCSQDIIGKKSYTVLEMFTVEILNLGYSNLPIIVQSFYVGWSEITLGRGIDGGIDGG
jgi:hypothetical protein